jgi:hypothetical protein
MGISRKGVMLLAEAPARRTFGSSPRASELVRERGREKTRVQRQNRRKETNHLSSISLGAQFKIDELVVPVDAVGGELRNLDSTQLLPQFLIVRVSFTATVVHRVRDIKK